jgi:hypothetical protein
LAVSVAPTTGVPLIVGAELTVGAEGSATAGAAQAPSVPTTATMKLMMRLDKSPPPCGPVREPTSWLESNAGQLDHLSSGHVQDAANTTRR